MRHRVRSFLATYLFVLCVVARVQGQTTATISGKVEDPTKAVLPGVSVTLQNVETGIARTVLTDDEGRYRATNLSPGSYEVTAGLAGFKTEVRRGIVLTIGREAVVNFTLDLGEMTEQVVVTGEAPLVDATGSQLVGQVETRQITTLPLNSRDFSQLITLQAGTVRYRQQRGSEVSGFGARISVGGARTTYNTFMLDGTDIRTSTSQTPSGVGGALLGVDTVREFRVLKSNYSAAEGRGAGANIVAITRSGTNDLHGTVFHYHRNSAVDARSFFDEENPPFKRNQFGFSLGGPIRKDKAFFFGSYEGLRERLGQTFLAVVPTVAARDGILPGRTVTVHPAVKPYLALYPLPNGRDFGSGTAEFTRADSQPTDEDFMTARIDHQWNDQYSFYGRYTFSDSGVSIPEAFELFRPVTDIRYQYLTLEQTSVLSPRLVNAFRVGFNRTKEASDLTPVVNLDPSLSFLSGRPFGTVNPGSGVTPLSGFGRTTPRRFFLNYYQLYDDLNLNRGRHALRFGVSVSRFIYNRHSSSRLGGLWEFGSLVDFLTNGRSRRLRIQGLNSDVDRTLFQTFFAAYAQDDVGVGRRLNLNLGMRYEFTTSPTEKFGRLANLRRFTDLTTTVGGPIYDNPTLTNFMPRVGLAWDPTGSGKTALRAGIGIFYQPILMRQFINTLDRQPPFFFDIDPPPGLLVAGLFPKLDAVIGTFAAGPQAVHVVDFNLDSPAMYQWSLSLQRSLTESLVAEVAYQGSRGVHLDSRQDLAVPMPDFLPDGRVFFPASRTVFLNPSFSRFEWYSTGSTSRYNALNVSIQKRFAGGFQVQGAYTFSRSLDTQSATTAGELNASTVQNAFDIESDKGLSEFHVTHRFTGNFTYELPLGSGRRWGRDFSGIVQALLGGWQVSGILDLNTGTPFEVESNGRLTHDLIRGGARPDLAPGGNSNPVLGGPERYFDPSQFRPQQPGFYGNLGRNTTLGPGVAMFDFSVMKNFQVGERAKIQFRSEFFNLPNRANFDLPSATVFDAAGRLIGSAGRIQDVVTTPRQIQFALRVEF
ncbi:MAG: carboxypeptidase regulatory-like domain-containing protein [Acidobacteria bacterium]|nr:carboxypeptidase regulatory-like domain-containing protein [Acidobacteriota bacterium]